MPTPSQIQSLSVLAAGINKAHTEATAAAVSALEKARRAGVLLRLAKRQLKRQPGHGPWLSWLAAECPNVSVQMAQRYMKIARGWPRIEAATKAYPGTYMSIRKALAVLAEPDDDQGDPNVLEPGGNDEAWVATEGNDEDDAKSPTHIMLFYDSQTRKEVVQLLADIKKALHLQDQSAAALAAFRYAHLIVPEASEAPERKKAREEKPDDFGLENLPAAPGWVS